MPSLVSPVIQPGAFGTTEQPRLAWTDVSLRPWKDGDATAVVTAHEDPTVQHWRQRSMTSAESHQTILDARRGWTEETSASWALVSEQQVVGEVGVRVDLAAGRGLLSYWSVPSYHHADIVVPALALATQWSFGIGLHRLELQHRSDVRLPVCPLVNSAGHPLDGIRRGHARTGDGWSDVHIHGSTADVWTSPLGSDGRMARRPLTSGRWPPLGVEAAIEMRRRHAWLDHVLLRLLGPGHPWDAPEVWLDHLAHAYRQKVRWQAACDRYEDDNPDPHHGGRVTWDEWNAGVPTRPAIVDALLDLDSNDDHVLRMLLTLGTALDTPGWRAISLGRMTERERPFVRDWLAVLEKYGLPE